MPEWLVHTLFPLTRWLHIVATALIVGGTLFFEFVVPRAIEEMRLEDQMSTIARMRWAFRRIIWSCVVILPITGLVSVYRLWPGYLRTEGTGYSVAWYWSLSHMVGGAITLIIAWALVTGGKVPTRARGWLKVNFVIMLAVMFLASASRHVRLFARDQQARMGQVIPSTLPPQK